MTTTSHEPPSVRKRARPIRMPPWVDPMLATFTNRRFSDPNWIFEYKLDGERCLAFKRSNGVRLLSRRLRTDKPAKDVVRARPQLSP